MRSIFALFALALCACATRYVEPGQSPFDPVVNSCGVTLRITAPDPRTGL